MKKLNKLFLMLATMLVTVIGSAIFVSADDYSAYYTSVSVNTIDDITDMLNVPGYGLNNPLTEVTTKGTYTYYYTFKVAKPSYIDIRTLTKGANEYYSGTLNVYLSTSKTFIDSPIITGAMTDEIGERKIALEAGTYYLKVTCTYNDSPLDNRYFNMGIYAQPITRTGSTLGTTMSKAISTGSSATGFFSKTSRTQYFKFTVGQKSDVALSTILTTPLQWKEGTATVKVLNSEGSVIAGEYHIYGGNYGNTANISIQGLSAGTYYVCAWTDSTNSYCTVKQNISVKDIYAPSAPKVTSFVSGNKYVSGTAEAGSTAYVTYNGKKYSAKVASNGTYKVTVPALYVGKAVAVNVKDKAGNTSSTTTVCVQNRKIATPKITAYKKNTTVVSGTAKAGTTVKVSYNGKTYKATVKSNGKYSVKVAKLVKGKKVSVKVTDSNGNYSSTASATVK